jgi:ATP-binding cassette subfamily B protein
VGAITMNLGLFQRAQGQVQGLSDAFASLNNNALFLEDYIDLMNQKSSIEGEGEDGLPAGGIRSIEFRNVSFAYPGSENRVLHNVSFRLDAGETVFMAGRNGAGKTTILKLLLRLYEPTEGLILINGRDSREISARSLRKGFAVLMQDYVRYPFSARENIVVGDIDDRDNQPRLTRAIEASRFSEVLPKLPDGLETYLQKIFFGGGPGGFKATGTDLSGGEWQKLALARAFFRASSVFILDEPTSNLDVQTESEILAYFREHVRDKMAIIVSHRLSAAAVADRVIFVDGGRIVEDGRHADLIQSDGPYAKLFRLQQDGFAFL